MKKRMILSIFWLILGVSLFGAALAGLLDEFWSGMGGGLMAVGILQLWRQFRYHTNETYREAVDTANSDERNKFLATKAWAWAGYWFVMVGALGTIAFKLLGQEQLSTFCGFSVCVLMVLYWVNWLWLRRKY